MSMQPFGPTGQPVDLTDPTASFEFLDLFSSQTQPILQIPSPSGREAGPPGSGIATSSQQASNSSSSSASTPPSVTTSNASRKRVRPKIALAPGQPPTARGNDRIRVYVACHECRGRKIRCDGAKPICFQCQKRPSESGACTYDAAPNRKGHDKRAPRASRTSAGTKPTKRRRTAVLEAAAPAPSDSVHESSSSSDNDRPSSPSPERVASSCEHQSDEVPEELLDFQLDEIWEYDPFSISIDHPELFQISPSGSPHSSTHGRQEEEDESIPSRPSTQFARDTWWDALLSFYALERDLGADMQAVSLTADQRNGALRLMVSDLRAMFQSSASWMSFIHLPRFFASVLDPVRRAEMQPSLLMTALAIGTLAQSSELEKGDRGRRRALKLLDMAHGALQGSLATGWVDVGLAKAGWLMLYFELNSHPMQSWERSQSAMLLLDSLVRLFSLTTLDSGTQRIGATGGPMHVSTTGGFAAQPAINMNAPSPSTTAFVPQPAAYIPQPVGTAYPPQYVPQEQFVPQINPHAFDPPVLNPFYANTLPFDQQIFAHIVPSPTSTIGANPSVFSSRTSVPRGHTGQQRRGCDCARLSLGRNWSAVREFAPAWSTTIMWPTGLSEAEFQKEECRRLVWGSVMMVASLNAYASVTPEGIIETGKMFVKEHENFALLLPSELLARTGVMVEADDIWSLNMRAMLLLHSCLRVRASPTMSGAQRAEFAVRAWLDIDDIEQRMERHTCNMMTNYGFQSSEMLFSLRICVSYEFQRFIPQITTTGNKLFYRDKAESWLRHLDNAVENVQQAMEASQRGNKDLDHRKSLFIFWFMSGIKKCIVLWEADPTLDLALTTGCKGAKYLEYMLMFWPCDRAYHLRSFISVVLSRSTGADILRWEFTRYTHDLAEATLPARRSMHEGWAAATVR
ncbi:hypothetical protein BV20DRAFT_962547 [Pilatotrama ljubarskyi]|nr:hypothetical protein BV20DRAFT_962547 [Pilatotrama ljubarskyi]